jgi:microcystin degradation protein MlrC
VTVRVAILGLYHEANTFADGVVSWRQLDAGTQRGEQILAAQRGAETTVAGFLDVLEETPGAEAVPLLYATVTPAGPLSSVAFDRWCVEAERLLRDEGPFDAVLLALHGAAVSELVTDVDGAICALVRAQVGVGVPVGVGFDMHANLTPAMAAAVDAMVGYRTNPHLDARERGREVAEIVLAAARGEVVPRLAFRQVPAVLNILCQGTDGEPMTRLLHEVAEL